MMRVSDLLEEFKLPKISNMGDRKERVRALAYDVHWRILWADYPPDEMLRGEWIHEAREVLQLAIEMLESARKRVPSGPIGLVREETKDDA